MLLVNIYNFIIIIYLEEIYVPDLSSMSMGHKHRNVYLETFALLYRKDISLVCITPYRHSSTILSLP